MSALPTAVQYVVTCGAGTTMAFSVVQAPMGSAMLALIALLPSAAAPACAGASHIGSARMAVPRRPVTRRRVADALPCLPSLRRSNQRVVSLFCMIGLLPSLLDLPRSCCPRGAVLLERRERARHTVTRERARARRQDGSSRCAREWRSANGVRVLADHTASRHERRLRSEMMSAARERRRDSAYRVQQIGCSARDRC